MGDYRYLFPFEKIPLGSRVLIYGAGVLGQEYLKQMMITGYCEVIGFADRNHASYPPMVVPVYAPEEIHGLAFDYVVVALRGGFGVPEVKRLLSEQKVRDEQVVCILERAPSPPVAISAVPARFCYVPAFEADRMSVALYLAGGIGDMICQKRFVMELLSLMPQAGIDIYAAQNVDFLRWLYSDREQVRNVLLDAGVEYGRVCTDYVLAISIFGSQFLRVEHFAASQAEMEAPVCSERIKELAQQAEADSLSPASPNALSTLRHICNEQDCYSWFNYNNVFFIKDRRVTIPPLPEKRTFFQTMGDIAYITVHSGNGSSKTGKGIAKTWPMEYFQKTILLFKKLYPSIAVVQVGAAEEAKLGGADSFLMGREFETVASVLQRAIFHLDIEGGLVHLASQLGTKCIVLFGPTQMEYYSYPQNINIHVDNCHPCAGLYPSVDYCARHMEKPKCMYGITPELVMEKITEYMQKRCSQRQED